MYITFWFIMNTKKLCFSFRLGKVSVLGVYSK